MVNPKNEPTVTTGARGLVKRWPVSRVFGWFIGILLLAVVVFLDVPQQLFITKSPDKLGEVAFVASSHAISNHASLSRTISNVNRTLQSDSNVNAQSDASSPSHPSFSSIFNGEQTGMIFGNPLHFDECRNGLLRARGLSEESLKQQMMDDLKSNTGTLSSKPKNLFGSGMVWTSEHLKAFEHRTYDVSLATMARANFGLTKNRTLLKLEEDWSRVFRNNNNDDEEEEGGGGTYPLSYSLAKRNRSRVKLWEEFNRRAPRAAYIQLPKCGSSSVAVMLDRWLPKRKYYNRSKSPFLGATYNDFKSRSKRDYSSFVYADCVFTFVRDPLDRLISAYFTENFFLWKMGMCLDDGRACAGKYEWINRTQKWWHEYRGEPHRFYSWLDMTFEEADTVHRVHPLQHHRSQIAFLSVFGTELKLLDFIGRIEQFNDHWHYITQNPQCKPSLLLDGSEGVMHAMHMEGTHSDQPKKWQLDPRYVKYLSLEGWNFKQDSKFLLPQYNISQEMFNRIVEYYWTDYVCLNYSMDYPHLGLYYTGNFTRPVDLT